MSTPWSHFTPSLFTFCEEQLTGWIVNPADTWTNIFFFHTAYVIYMDQRRGPVKNLFVVTTLIVGTGSTLFHGTMTQWGAILDMYTMIAMSMLFLTLSLKEYLQISPVDPDRKTNLWDPGACNNWD